MCHQGETMSTLNITNATILIQQNGQTVQTLTTDQNGQASCSLNAGTYDVTISALGYNNTNFNMVINSDNSLANFDLGSQPKVVWSPSASERLIETVSVSATPQVFESISESVNVNSNPEVSEGISESVTASNQSLVSESFSENIVVTISASTWMLNILVVYDTSTLQNGSVAPLGVQNIASGQSLTIDAETKQYSLYNYEIVDGLLQNNNSTTKELVDTNHPYTVPVQNAGTTHQLSSFFRAAWELTVSGSTVDGTYEVLSGTSYSATPNLGSPPVCYYDYDIHGNIIGTHYATYQWYLDGMAVGYGSSSYTVPAQTTGTSHTLSATWTCYGV
jgi:Carboxypeptidase regulatory-like domain